MYKKKRCVVFFLFFMSFFLLFTEEKPLPKGYKEFHFGMKKEEVKEVIRKNKEFIQGREEVLSVRMEPDKEILTVVGENYVEKAYFHFHKDRLFHIYLILSDSKIGYYSLLKSLTEEYGNPTRLEPKRAFWENSVTRMQIEKPCVIKYTDIQLWNSLDTTEEEVTKKNLLKTEREKFLEDL